MSIRRSCRCAVRSVGRRVVVLMLGAVLLGPLAGPLPAARGQAPDTSAAAPRYTMAFRSVPLDDALQRLVARTGIDLAYSTALVEGKTVYCRVRGATVEPLLSCLLAGTGVDYLRTASGSYLLVDSPEAPPPRGRIAGRVVDAATGEPLPDANVLLADANVGTATDAAGHFTVAPVVAGRHRLVVTYVGYRTAIDSVAVPADGRDTIRVALSPRVVDAPPVVVDGLQRRLPSATLGRDTVGADALTQLSARGTPDVLRTASRRMGVALNRPLAEVTVQGGSGGEHVVQLDGVPVREPVNLGGLLSAFSPQALGRLTIHKAGFGAPEGSYTAGVLEASHDLSRAGSRFAAASADPLSVNGRADAAWSTAAGAEGRAMVAGRTSVWDTYRAASLHDLLRTRTALDQPLTPSWVGTALDDGAATQRRATHVRFTDLHGALRQDLTPFQTLSASGYWGDTRMGTDVASVGPGSGARRALFSQDRYDWSNRGAQLRYDWLAGSRVTGRLQLWGSRHASHTFFGIRTDSVAAGTSPPGPPAADERLRTPHSAEGNELTEWGGRAAVDVSLSPRTRLRAAVAPQFFRGAFRVRNPFLGVLEHETRDWQVASYAEAQVSPGLRWTATAGTRLTYVQARDAVYAEPRVSLRYDRPSTPLGGLAVRVAGGLYRQFVTEAEISSAGPTAVVPSVQFWLPVDRTLAPARAYHAAGSLLLTPTPDWSVRLESYYKWQPRTLQVDYAGLVAAPTPEQPVAARPLDGQADLMAPGRGRAYGAAVHVQAQGRRVSGGLTAEWSRAERRYPGRFDGRFVPAPWEQPLRLSADLDVRLADGLHAVGHWKGIWGRSWALRRGYYDYLALAGTAPFPGHDLSRPGTQTLAPFSRLDLGLRGTTTLRGVALEAQFTLVNVLDRHNPFDRSLTSATTAAAPAPRTLPGRRAFVLLELRY